LPRSFPSQRFSAEFLTYRIIFMTNIAKEQIPKEQLEPDLWLNPRRFYIGLAIALILQLWLISQPFAFWLDINLFKAWAVALVQQGLPNFYSFANSDYPPAYLYILWLVGKTYQFFDPTFSHTDRLLLVSLLKLPCILANVGSAFLIAQILKPYTSTHKAYKIALIYAFNPLMIFVSAIWGQVDGVMVLLMSMMFYLIEQNRAISAGILAILMVIVKPQGLFFAPFLFLSQWFRQAWWKWLAIAVGGLAAIWLLIEPFFGVKTGLSHPFWSLYYLLKSTANLYSFGSVNAFNIWIWANWQSDYATFLGISYKVIGLYFLGILIVWLGIFLYRQRNFTANAMAAATMLIGCFMLPTRMHERYMLYSLAFLAIAIAVIPIVKWIYWGFTLTGAVNVGYVYLRYNYEALYNAIPSGWLQTGIYAISVFNVILFLILLLQTIRFPKAIEASGGEIYRHSSSNSILDSL